MKSGMKIRHGMIAAMALAAGTAVSTASVWEFNWFPFSSAGGTVAYSAGSAPYYSAFKVTGGNNGNAGETDFDFYAAEDLTLTISGTYSSTDSGEFDFAYYAVNGAKTTFATNATQGPVNVSFNVQKGDVVWIGVETTDGSFGPGILDITYCEPTMTRGFEDFVWRSYDDGPFTASFVFPPPTLEVTGGNGGAAERAYLWSYLESPSTFTYGGTYASGDSGTFDTGFYYVYSGAPSYTDFVTNGTQGPVNGVFGSGGGTSTYEGQFGMGVNSTDGGFGPGVLTINSFSANQLTGWMSDMPFGFTANGTGGTGSISGSDMTIVGGNNNVAGDSQYTVFASQSYTVQASVTYSSGDSGCFDSAYYIVNGVKTTIACNDAPGTYDVSFEVQADQVFGFGVSTSDGSFGAGTAVVRRFRAFPANNDAAPACYPDCDGDTALTIDDFICFQTTFALGDPYADCDGDSNLTIDDFICFQTLFAIGC